MRRNVIHLQLGSDTNPATVQDLEKVAKLISETEIPVLPSNSYATSYSVDPDRETFTLRVGALNWKPTDAEMKLLSNAFSKASLTGGYVVTRNGVVAAVVPKPTPVVHTQATCVYIPKEDK